jgi:hypothetical protein
LIRRLRDLLENESQFYRLLLAIGGTTAVLKGLRMPYIWAATQAQIDYRYGYLHRGLFGEICRRLHIPIWHYGFFSALAFALLIALLWLLARSMRESGLDAAGMGAFSALLASSFSITMLTNLVGYYDILMALLVLVVLQFRKPSVQMIVVLAAGVLGVLVHELYAIAFLPVSLAGVVCGLATGSDRKKKLWAGVAAAIIIPWMIVPLPLGHARMTPAEVARLAVSIRERVNFPSHDEVLSAIFGNSTAENVHRMWSFMHAGTYWIEECFGLLAFLPTTLFFLALAWRFVGRRRGLRWYFALCTFAPLLLNIVAYDRYRWLSIMELNAVLCAIIACWSSRRIQGDDGQPVFGLAWRRAAVLLFAVNLATDIGLFQGHSQSFPFVQYWHNFHTAPHLRSLFGPPDIVL